MIVLSNSSPLIALSSIDRLDILANLFTTVYIPDAVYQETVTDNPILPQRTRIDHATHSFIQVRQLAPHDDRGGAARVLDRGNAHGILDLKPRFLDTRDIMQLTSTLTEPKSSYRDIPARI